MLATMTEAEILRMIDERQAVCRRYPATHPLWQKSSRILQELYAEMSRRSKA